MTHAPTTHPFLWPLILKLSLAIKTARSFESNLIQYSMKNLLIFIISLMTTVLGANDITGKWNGVLEVQGMQLRIVFNIEAKADSLVTTMDSPDQGAFGIPTDVTTYENNVLTIAIKAMQLEYTRAILLVL